ncbi:MAG: Glycine-rich RNA-binding protein GRP1A [Candidatus Yanofskybacteria bacterium GW2011_GWA1_44_21]|uniref:Glycine-rich RNA-binding protein GRP1A n=1 Tax=Candidatus Yanofskybacteria bacterium GW2011_GWB1_45_11 TaxID=1619026 RepID=A0A0G1L2V3_9BACT|nr:MAG: Glycine-rich RNA-binding protein GRP1A [Candidatus Yanofskybacteria bacterium GW2011_GWA1_44_21]KKT90108.1 MAG: Glycine-rich RNA-binding protein GRP1A [Candidatus Yanofskybacteria bacterium GW2011_GWB1_45_11]
MKKLYVGNLPYTATDDQLRDMFTQHGAVSSASVLMDKMTGRSRGFGFVEMENDEEALKAVDALNGTDFDGRKLVVNEARPMTERAPRRGGFGGGGGGGGFSRGGGRGGFGGGY